MIKLPEKLLRDEAEMRAFYRSVGISPQITEAAIRERRGRPTEEAREPPAKGEPVKGEPAKGKMRKAVPQK
jgi:hypothetical protein